MSHPSPPAVSTLVIDPRGVLYDESCWPRWLVQQLARMGLEADYPLFFRLLECEYLPAVYCGSGDFWTALRCCLSEMGLGPARIAELEMASLSRWRQSRQEMRLLPGVHRVLARLINRGMNLVVATNACEPATALTEHLQRMGAPTHCLRVVTSQEVKQVLPAPATFHAMAEAIGFSPNDSAFLSDDAAAIEGASAAGLYTVSFEADPPPAANVLIRRLMELPDVLPGNVAIETPKRAAA